MPRNGRATPLGVLAVLAVLVPAAPALAQPDVTIEKSTNGEDADSTPGPAITVGDPVNWTYTVTNTGSRPLTNIVVTDDQGVVVSCPAATLDAGLSFVCTAADTAVAGQYANVGTVDAELPDATQVSDSDPSHYFGQAAPAVDLEKSTEGFDADLAPGPSLAAGETVDWQYEVTNIGADDLSDIVVTDDQGVSVSCPGTDLAPGASMTCTASGTVQPGQYVNLGTVTAMLPDESLTVDSDPSHYFGQTLLLEKATNGLDADGPPGPTIESGDPLSWTYEVTNPGPATVTGLAVSDDQGEVVSCPQTTLTAGESVTCTAAGTAVAGQYANVGTATANLPLGGQVSASDPSHYSGTAIRMEKSTNGQDADLPPGPVVAPGAAIAWTYEVTNFSADTVTDVEVTDDQGVTVTCPGTTLAAGEAMICTANGTAVAGQYANSGTVTATHPTLGVVADSDPSHYFGADQVLDYGDAADPTYPTLFASNGARHLLGSGVYLGACVDGELDGQPGAAATGDDTGVGIPVFGTCAGDDDEDGVTFPGPLPIDGTGEVHVVANEPCTLSAWIDFSADGDWFDAGETIFPGGTPLTAGTNILPVVVPASAVPGQAPARFRCTTDGAVPFVGEASDGEVEDLLVTVGSPELAATKTASLDDDADGDGVPSGGDSLLYTVVVVNDGTAVATGVAFTDTPDPATTLVPGSVTTTAGTVTTGNGAGDSSVAVDVGTLAAGGGSVTITYAVVINDPVPNGVDEVVNQGTVTSDAQGPVLTDDPSPPGGEDPTVVSVVGAAVVEIPALGAWGAGLLLALLAGLGLRRLARA